MYAMALGVSSRTTNSTATSTDLDLVHCTDGTVRANNASGDGNGAIHLLDSSRNTIEGNRANRCIRYAGRFWNDTTDSAGILLKEYSHENCIVGNTMRYRGDGRFIRANNRHSSNGDYAAGNDGSFSPNNAFEDVFSEGNIVEASTVDYSNYSFWLGYYRNTVVWNNRISSNRLDGIAIEHGRVGNRTRIRLWAGGRDHETARPRDYSNTEGVLLEDNSFRGNAEDVSEA